MRNMREGVGLGSTDFALAEGAETLGGTDRGVAGICEAAAGAPQFVAKKLEEQKSLKSRRSLRST